MSEADRNGLTNPDERSIANLGRQTDVNFAIGALREEIEALQVMQRQARAELAKAKTADRREICNSIIFRGSRELGTLSTKLITLLGIRGSRPRAQPAPKPEIERKPRVTSFTPGQQIKPLPMPEIPPPADLEKAE